MGLWKMQGHGEQILKMLINHSLLLCSDKLLPFFLRDVALFDATVRAPRAIGALGPWDDLLTGEDLAREAGK